MTQSQAKEVFRLDMIRWLNECNPKADFSDRGRVAAGLLPLQVSNGIDIATWRAIDEVRQDIKSGIVPNTVRSFSELHDHVDANGYGGAFFWPCLPSDGDDIYQDEFLKFWNAVQNAVHRWVKNQAGKVATS